MFLHEAEGTDVGALLVLRSAEGQVAGYCACWVVAGELHINNIAVAPAWRGRRLGSALLGAVLDRARGLGATRATLEVRSSNTAALALYARFGFRWSRYGAATTKSADDGLILWKCELGSP
jgi:ribosomal-protein-alanine N-acetyltransferase